MEGLPSQSTNYYFQIIITHLACTSSHLSLPQLVFTVSKGKQLFEFTQILSPQWTNQAALIDRQRLNFVVLNYQGDRPE